MMTTELLGWLRERVGFLVMLLTGLVSSGPAFADTYNLVLKASGTAFTRATGEVSFTKTTVEDLAPSKVTVAVPNQCFFQGGTYSSDPQDPFLVAVDDFMVNGQPQRTNAFGPKVKLKRVGN